MAVFNIQIPNVKNLDMTDTETQRVVMNYLFELSDKLNYALNNLDYGNFDKETYIDLSNLKNDKDNLSDIVNTLEENTAAEQVRIYNELRNQIIQTASQLSTDYTDRFLRDSQRMDSLYTEINRVDSSVGTLEETFDSALTQTARDITASVSSLSQIVTNNKSDSDSFRSSVETYIRFSLDGLTLGKSDSQFTAKLDNTKLAFIQGGSEVAYISNNKLYITDANVTGTLSIGNTNTGYYDWILESNNSFSLARRTV